MLKSRVARKAVLTWSAFAVGLLVCDRAATASGIGDAPGWSTLAGALALGGLLFWSMRRAINTRTDARRIAERLTEEVKRHEQLLSKSESFKLAILNALPAEITVVGRDGTILAVNEPWRRFAFENGREPGRPAANTGVGTNYLDACRTGADFTRDDDGATAREGIRAVLDGRLPSFTLEYPCHSPAHQRWFTMTVTPLEPETSTGVVITHTDITQRKLLEEERHEALRLLQKIASRVPGAVYQFRLRADGTACLPFASDGLREVYRVSPDEVREDASPLFAVHHPDDNDRVIASIQESARDLTPWVHEYRVKFDDGTVRWLFANALPEREADGSTLWHGFLTDITQRKQADAAIAEAQTLLLTVIDTAPIRVFWKDRNLRYLGCNTAFAKDAGMTHPQDVIGKDDYQLGWAAQAELYRADDRAVMASGIAKLFYDEQQTSPSGQTIWLRTSKVALRNLDNTVFGLLGIYEDVTERKLAEEKLHLAARVFTHAWEGIMITAADGTIIDVNDAFTRITSYGRDEVLGQNPRLLSSGQQGQGFYAAMWGDLIERGQWSGEIWNRRQDGEVYAVMQTISAVRDAQGTTRHYVALFSDITLIKEQERALQHIAHFDALTCLPNRVLLADRLRQGMVQAQRYGRLLAVAFLDLDGFKAINDQHGHAAGDQLLIAAATGMQRVLREGDTLARIGGDEFVAVLLDLADIQASVPMLTRLLGAAAQSVPVGGHTLQVSASVGVTFYPQADDIDAEQLLRQADQAMYQAKLAGKNRYHVFDAELDRSVRGYHESLERIRSAFAEREFVLHYQPKVNMRTGTIIGAEALIRWQHPQSGLLPPGAFLPVIEDHPLAVEIGEWVIETALSEMECWQAAGLNIPVSVNVGARQLQQADFVERLRRTLAAHPNVGPGDLALEVLETSALADLARVSQVIDACRGIGVMCALDDFGTGYASLTYLKRLPVNQIKIDQSFVRDMLDDPDDLAILDGVIGLCVAFHRQVIAEGVATLEQGEMLLRLGCELAQGFGIARPMPAGDLPGWAASWRPDRGWVDLAPVSRDAVPLLFAGAAHRAWIAAVEAYLQGERDAPPAADDHQGCFGPWLDGDPLRSHGARPAFAAIEPLRRRVHTLAAELCELRAQGRIPEALARLGELHGLRDAVLGQLKRLVQEQPGMMG